MHISALTMASLVTADMVAMERTMLSLYQQVLSAEMRSNAVPPNLVNVITNINGKYGCYCAFDDVELLASMGHGVPATNMDAYCQQLQAGYACGILDTDDSCDPARVNYTAATDLDAIQFLNIAGFSPFEAAVDEERLFDVCMQNNLGDDCAIYACTVEGNFVINTFAYVLEAELNLRDPLLGDEPALHSNGFDPAANCTKTPRTGVNSNRRAGPKECCGTYPNRFSYKTDGGLRACCGDRTYNTAKFSCCDNGQIAKDCALIV